MNDTHQSPGGMVRASIDAGRCPGLEHAEGCKPCASQLCMVVTAVEDAGPLSETKAAEAAALLCCGCA